MIVSHPLESLCVYFQCRCPFCDTSVENRGRTRLFRPSIPPLCLLPDSRASTWEMDNNKETVRREMSNSCMRTLLLYHQKCACWNANGKYLIICDSNGCIHFTANKGVFLFKYQILSKEEQEQNVYFFSFLEP